MCYLIIDHTVLPSHTREKFMSILPDPKHPWKDPLKNNRYKWYELLDDPSHSYFKDHDHMLITKIRCKILKLCAMQAKSNCI